MYKPFFLPAVLLFVFSSDQVQAQALRLQTQSPTNINGQTDSKVTPGWPEPTAEAKSLYEDGMARLERGQVSEAVERFQEALRIDPKYAEAYSALGRSFFKLRQWENASGVLRRAIALKAQQRDRQAALHKNEARGITPSIAPVSPATKPQGIYRNDADTTASSTRIRIAQPERQTPSKSSVAPQPPNLNQPLPTLRINAESAETTLDSELEPPQPPRVEPANIKSDNLQIGPPPPVPQNVDAVPPPAVKSETVKLNQPQQAGVAVQSVSQLNRDDTNASSSKPEPVDVQIAMDVTPVSSTVEAKSVTASPITSTDEIALTNTYRVGSKDVLDIRLNISQPRQTTAYMVTQSGLLEHPHLSEPLTVSGLTVEEIRAKIEEDLKGRAVIEDPKVFVAVLEHASHTIVVDGLVKNPGTKFLKSEAIPLASVLAEAKPLVVMAKLTVLRNGRNILETEVSHTADMSFLVHPGDVVTLHPQVNEVFYVGGKVKFPGEKSYRVGLTLMQAIITAGGAISKSKVAEIVRDDGELVRTRFDLKAIESGKAADPSVKPRDRIILH